MKYTLRRYWPYTLFLIVGIVLLSRLAYAEVIPGQVLLGGVATLLTIFITIINLYQSNDKFFKELFTEFNRRYDVMNNFLNQIKPDEKLSPDDRQRVVDYLNLCAEEYMWVRKGRIPQHIWQSWKNGIKAYMQNPTIKEVFNEERALWKSSYYGFFDEMNGSIT